MSDLPIPHVHAASMNALADAVEAVAARFSLPMAAEELAQSVDDLLTIAANARSGLLDTPADAMVARVLAAQANDTLDLWHVSDDGVNPTSPMDERDVRQILAIAHNPSRSGDSN
jgi:hypothetical protein